MALGLDQLLAGFVQALSHALLRARADAKSLHLAIGHGSALQVLDQAPSLRHRIGFAHGFSFG